MTQLPTPAFNGLYGDLILDHFRNPRNRKPVAGAQVMAQEFNPFCGDKIELQLKLDSEGRVSEVCTQSEGCSIIQSSSSMMSESLKGKLPDEISRLAEQFRQMMRGDTAAEGARGLGELESLAVVREYPVRIKCALLPWTALEGGLQAYSAKIPSTEDRK